MTVPGRKYRFSWTFIGDIGTGRPNLGPMVGIEVYRLMEYTFRDVLEEEFGTKKADEIFYRAGFLAGTEFYRNVIGNSASFNDFIKKFQTLLAGMKIGILKIEKADFENDSYIMTLSEDLDCSGLPDMGFGVCTYDEGFLAGLMESYTSRPFTVKEIDCWCTGDRTCRFSLTRSE